MWDHNADQWVREGVRSMGVRPIWWIYGSNKKSSRDWPSRNMTGGAGNRDGTPRWIQPQPPPSPTLPVVLYLLIHLQSPSRSPAATTRRGERPLPSSAMLSGDAILMYFTFSSSLSLSLILCFLPIFLSLYSSLTHSLSLFLSHFRYFRISPFPYYTPDSLWIKSRDQTTKQVRVVCGRVIFTHP